ncbi:endonuclease V [Bacillus pumilus]|uniref:endonuclease V n=1 Tax=Bacillus pumilus TaxID=1408 RepID=UPI00273F6EE2|nr:endonuclease V [Bacillus pumilus]MEB2359394.1 endonuclease V [Bacillus pumilus]WLP60191.1 endonuclease V [Bacillus pumilus]
MNSGKMNELLEKFKSEQNALLPKVQLKNSFQLENIRYIAGVDVAYFDIKGKTNGVCCIVVFDLIEKQVIEKVHSHGEIMVPYIAGFLAFREIPLIKDAVKKLTKQVDVYMFDGNGYLHYRHMGIATQASFFLNKPTIGVAKSYLKINGINFTMPQNKENDYTDIVINNEIYGRVLRTRVNVKPIFISCGNWIDLDTTTEIVMKLIDKNSRLPIPVRFADIETHAIRKELLAKE